MRLALFQPDIPQNTGTLLRFAACMGLAVDIIEPCGFLLDDRRLRRAGMDYLDNVTLTRHNSWDRFLTAHNESGARLVLLTTKSTGGQYKKVAPSAAVRLILVPGGGHVCRTRHAYPSLLSRA